MSCLNQPAVDAFKSIDDAVLSNLN